MMAESPVRRYNHRRYGWRYTVLCVLLLLTVPAGAMDPATAGLVASTTVGLPATAAAACTTGLGPDANRARDPVDSAMDCVFEPSGSTDIARDIAFTTDLTVQRVRTPALERLFDLLLNLGTLSKVTI